MSTTPTERAHQHDEDQSVIFSAGSREHLHHLARVALNTATDAVDGYNAQVMRQALAAIEDLTKAKGKA